MPRTHTQLPRRLLRLAGHARLPRDGRTPGSRALAVLVSGALLVTPVTPEASASTYAPPPPPPAAGKTPPPPAKIPPPPTTPNPATEAPAGDENIPLETPEEGERKPIEKARTSNGAVQSASYSIGRKGNAEAAAEIAAQADAAFDAENYGEAARLYTKVLELLSENETNHVTRSVVLANAVTSYEQVYTTTREVNHLRTAQRLLQEYLRACKTKHGTGCDRYPETQEARARLQSVMAEIDIAAPRNMRLPPEIDRAPGGKAYDLTVKLPAAPSWIAPTMVGGALVAGGGAALIYYAATADKYGPIYKRDLPGETGDTTTADTTTADTTTDTSTDGTATGGTTTGITGYELSPDTKGKLLIGVGAFLAAAGIGFIILGAMGISKHRRANRRRAQSLAVTPTFGRSSAGLAISGSF